MLITLFRGTEISSSGVVAGHGSCQLFGNGGMNGTNLNSTIADFNSTSSSAGGGGYGGAGVLMKVVFVLAVVVL